MKPAELLNVIKRNGISLTEIEANWLISFLDPNGLNQLFVEDLLALLEISGNSDYDDMAKKERASTFPSTCYRVKRTLCWKLPIALMNPQMERNTNDTLKSS